MLHSRLAVYRRVFTNRSVSFLTNPLLRRTYLVDFVRPDPSKKKDAGDGSAPSAANSLITWVLDYFDGVPEDRTGGGKPRDVTHSNALERLKGGGVLMSKKMPIFLQASLHN